MPAGDHRADILIGFEVHDSWTTTTVAVGRAERRRGRASRRSGERFEQLDEPGSDSAGDESTSGSEQQRLIANRAPAHSPRLS